jgi:hypothetical protein
MCIWWKSRFSKTLGNLDRTNTRELSRIVATVENKRFHLCGLYS